MSVYWIGRAQVRDPEGFREYGRLVSQAVEKYPNVALARAGAYRVLEGEDAFDRYVLLKFPSTEAAITYYNSPEYQQAAAIRRAAAGRCEIVITDGLD